MKDYLGNTIDEGDLIGYIDGGGGLGNYRLYKGTVKKISAKTISIHPEEDIYSYSAKYTNIRRRPESFILISKGNV